MQAQQKKQGVIVSKKYFPVRRLFVQSSNFFILSVKNEISTNMILHFF